MKQFINKLIDRLEKLKASGNPYDSYWDETMYRATELVNSTSNKTIDGVIEIVNQLAEEYNNDGWIPCSKQLPPHSDDLLLIQCSGKPKNNIVFDNAFCLASYTKEGWLLELYPEWKGAEVIAWMPLPEPFKPIAE